MTINVGGKMTQRCRADQRGVALMEYLVALAVLTITIGGIAYATLGAGDVGKAGDRNARLNVLVTSFGEAVKALPYKSCAGLDAYEVPVSQLTNSAEAQVDVLRVEVDCTSGEDPGVQTVTLRAVLDGRETERTVVKRTPEAALKPLRFSIVDPYTVQANGQNLWFGGVDDPQRGVYLRAQGESDIFLYEWWCDGKWASTSDPSPDPTTAPSYTAEIRNDSGAQCLFEARPETLGPENEEAYDYIALRVTEAITGRQGTTWIRVLKPTTPVPHLKPTARIAVTAPGTCDSAAPCVLGPDRTLEVAFASTGPNPVDGQIVMWEWDFGDGTPTFVCTATFSDPVGSQCVNPTHRFQGGSDYPVTLYVTDNFGRRSDRAQRNVLIGGLPIVKPTVADSEGTSGLTATPSVGLASAIMPLRVAFDASGSHANNSMPGVGTPPGGIVEYEWDFDVNDFNTAPDDVSLNATPTHQYFNPGPLPRLVRARVTVRDIYGFEMTAYADITVHPFTAPPTFANVGARADCPLPLLVVTIGLGCRSVHDGYFDYQWVNVPRSPGDTVVIEVRMSQAAGWGLCTALGFFHTTTRSFPAGEPGTVQTARFSFSSGNTIGTRGYNGICAIADGYQYEVRTILTNAHGTFESNWTTPPRKTRSPQL